jgi:hypothetical protein
MAIIYGTLVFFGIPEKIPPLPKGWRVHLNHADWARVVSPDGHWYFLGVDHIYKIGYSTKEMVAAGYFKKEGEAYVCTQPLPLPT